MEPVVVALDFETADNGPDAACALGMARVRGSRVEDVFYRLIRPPRRRVWYTNIHGITWNMVKDCPSFGELWPECATSERRARQERAHRIFHLSRSRLGELRGRRDAERRI